MTEEKKTPDELREEAEKSKTDGSERAEKLEEAAEKQEAADEAKKEADEKK